MGLTTGSNSKFTSLFQNCVLWWPGSHCAGYTNDIDEFPIIPSGVTVTNNGTWTKTDLGNNKSVLNFNGNSNYISYTNVSTLQFGSNNFTVSFWIKLGTTATCPILDGRSVYGYLTPINIVYNSGTTKFEFLCSAGTAWDIDISSTTSPSINTWYFITVTRSGSVFNIYINSLLESTGTSSAALYTSNSLFYIGVFLASAAHLNGNLKDLMIWNGKALSQAEIKMLMIKTHPITGTGLMPGPKSYWRLS